MIQNKRNVNNLLFSQNIFEWSLKFIKIGSNDDKRLFSSSNDGNYLAILNYSEEKILLFSILEKNNVATWKLNSLLQLEQEQLFKFTFSMDSKYLLHACYYSIFTYDLINVTQGAVIHLLYKWNYQISSDNYSQLYIGFNDHYIIEVYFLLTGKKKTVIDLNSYGFDPNPNKAWLEGMSIQALEKNRNIFIINLDVERNVCIWYTFMCHSGNQKILKFLPYKQYYNEHIIFIQNFGIQQDENLIKIYYITGSYLKQIRKIDISQYLESKHNVEIISFITTDLILLIKKYEGSLQENPIEVHCFNFQINENTNQQYFRGDYVFANSETLIQEKVDEYRIIKFQTTF